MNREIKFRAWDTTYKDMHDVVLLDLDSEDSAVVYVDEYGDRQRRSLIHMDLMQFTGLKDKNGKEIYEGDIVRALTERVSSSHSTWYQRTNEHHGGVTLDMQVVWNEEECKFSLRLCRQSEREQKEKPVGKEKQYQHVHVPIDMYDRKCCVRGEVVGNIYENPELLER